MIYLIVKPLTTEVIGENWSTRIEAMDTLAIKLGGVVVNASYLRNRGVGVGILETGYPRKLIVGAGISAISLTELKPAPWGGGQKSEASMHVLMSYARRENKKKKATT